MNGLKVKFDPDTDFYRELRSRIDDYFTTTGRSTRDVPQVYLKTAVIMVWLFVSYGLLVFVASTWWQAVPLAISLGLAMAGIGFNVQHDGNHGAFSKRRSINRIAGMTLDLLGGSSYLWKSKHNLHHNFPNISGADEDIDLSPIAHLSPRQPLYAIHRFQHFYIWFFYCLLALKWHFVGDSINLIRGHIGGHAIQRPKGWEAIILLGGKTLFFFLAFVLPAVFHEFWVVLIFYAITSIVVSLVLSVIFQLAHCVEEANFPLPIRGTKQMERPWAIHQVESSVDFSRTNRWLTWYVGGLNFQIEHHLFPTMCHFHYPEIAPIVETVCAEFGLKYSSHPTFYAALVSHFRFLRLDRMALRPLV
jgi:linoleoyl-CoA desaturase